MLCTEREKDILFLGRVGLGTWSMWPSLIPKLWWSAIKLPFTKWDERHPDGKAFIAKERWGVLHLRFKPCKI